MKNRPHDAAVVELLKADPDFANEYLAAALDEADEPGGQTALLAALRHPPRDAVRADRRRHEHEQRHHLHHPGEEPGRIPDRQQVVGIDQMACCDPRQRRHPVPEHHHDQGARAQRVGIGIALLRVARGRHQSNSTSTGK